jgi:glycosyltransferase involved in cell wall biosynthesis
VVSAAFSAGAPVVATDVGGLSEAVTGGRDGLLFRLGDAAGLARCLERLVGEPGLLPELRRGIGPVKTIEENAEELESLYNGLVSGV